MVGGVCYLAFRCKWGKIHTSTKEGIFFFFSNFHMKFNVWIILLALFNSHLLISYACMTEPFRIWLPIVKTEKPTYLCGKESRDSLSSVKWQRGHFIYWFITFICWPSHDPRWFSKFPAHREGWQAVIAFFHLPTPLPEQENCWEIHKAWLGSVPS